MQRYAQHHCRSCGGLFCSECSSKFVLMAMSSKAVRVCDECFAFVKMLKSGVEAAPPAVESTESIMSSEGDEVSIGRPKDQARSDTFILDEDDGEAKTPTTASPGQPRRSPALQPDQHVVDDGLHDMPWKEVTIRAGESASGRETERMRERDICMLTHTYTRVLIFGTGKSFSVDFVAEGPDYRIEWEFKTSPKDISFAIAFTVRRRVLPVLEPLTSACSCAGNRRRAVLLCATALPCAVTQGNEYRQLRNGQSRTLHPPVRQLVFSHHDEEAHVPLPHGAAAGAPSRAGTRSPRRVIDTLAAPSTARQTCPFPFPFPVRNAVRVVSLCFSTASEYKPSSVGGLPPTRTLQHGHHCQRRRCCHHHRL
jgi:hypothetical protein